MRISEIGKQLLGLLVLAAVAGCHRSNAADSSRKELSAQTRRAYLNMPPTANGTIPKLLSQVGAFKDVKTLAPAAGLVEYDVNVPFWSDGAAKRRWIALPAGQTIQFAAQGEWRFPAGTVFVKHFEIPATGAMPARRLETRVLVRDAKGGVYGATYRWRADNSDADLVEQATTIAAVGLAAGKYYLPSSHDCQTCHIPASGGVLGVKTRQLNRIFGAGGENQLVAWEKRGMFAPGTTIDHPEQLQSLAKADDVSRSIGDRARSWLDANCSNCHRPNGVAGYFDARFDTPLQEQNLVDGPVLINLGIDRARVFSPADVWRSIALARVETLEGTRMPPLGHLSVDCQGAELLRQWIASMPGKPVLAPPTISPKGGEYQKRAVVTLTHSDPGATIHYTLDGSLPLKDSPVYSQPIRLTDPTTLRARAYKDGMMQSIAVQETFMVDP